ncbi:mitochondrial 2-oxoglutarate malate carrier [Fusarium mexicanum]|uniref:Mitochondrial 2-oxoglutarate malate carrier n=1 Tax=Fusarium mexicanum TaxID=751941 RepID=A0A8H5IPY3_9HYPO|nr:mitochondrial 2-oxoglutarate malate carrier [Fusarium mexicanum]
MSLAPENKLATRTLPYSEHLAATLKPFIIGGASGLVATTCIHPIDVIKVRLQLAGQGGSPSSGLFSVARGIVSQGRFLDLYQGISAGYLRQLVYGTARLGFFYTFEDALKKRASAQDRDINFMERSMAGLLAGGLGSLIGTPTEVALIRMQSDGMKPRSKRANYSSAFDALSRITRAEGIRGLWSGTTPTVIRACSTNFGQLTFFSEAKYQLATHTELSPYTQSLVAAAIAGTFAAVLSLPFDFVKTRMQWQNNQQGGRTQYTGFFDCIVKVARTEGLVAFGHGFVPYFFRIAPHA